MKLLNNKIAIERETKAPKTTGGFLAIPDKVDTAGIVRLIADGVTEVSLGNKVYFSGNYQPLKVEGHEYLIMEVSNLIAVLESEDEPKRENV